VDSNNNVYVTGVFLASISFGTTTLFGMGSWDVYVVKIDSDGTWQWAVSVGSSATEGAWGIAVDHNDHPFICGVFGGVVTIGESTIISLDSHDVFVATLDDMGTWQWAMSAGGTNWDEGYALTSDKNGSIYVTGYFDGSAFFGNTTLFTQGDFDVFIAKLTYLNGNEPPVADFNYSPRTPRVGQPVTFDASYSYDPDGDIISYEWDFGDETAGNGMIIDHVYSWSGSFSVSLKVTDRENAVDTLVKTIEVLAASEDFNFSITGGLGISAIITNPGTEDARDVPWLIHVEGGILGLVNKVAEGTIDIIPAGQSTSVKTGLFLGFGPILITVRAGASEKTVEEKQVIIFSKVNDEQFLL